MNNKHDTMNFNDLLNIIDETCDDDVELKQLLDTNTLMGSRTIDTNNEELAKEIFMIANNNSVDKDMSTKNDNEEKKKIEPTIIVDRVDVKNIVLENKDEDISRNISSEDMPEVENVVSKNNNSLLNEDNDEEEKKETVDISDEIINKLLVDENVDNNKESTRVVDRANVNNLRIDNNDEDKEKDIDEELDGAIDDITNEVVINTATLEKNDFDDVKNTYVEEKEDMITNEVVVNPVVVNKVEEEKIDNNQDNNIEKEVVSSTEIVETKEEPVDEEKPQEEDVGDKTKNILSNKKFLIWLSIITFVVVSIVVVKAFYLGDKVDEYEEFFTEITEIEDDSIKVYEGNMIDTSVIKKMAASELINCIKEPVDMDNLPEELKSKIYEINRFYNKSNNYFAFAYKDIFTGFTVTYNANQIIFTASAIKGPTDIYIWEMASQGKVDLDEMVTYTGNYYNTGSGVLKNKPIGGQYSVRTLLEYSTVTSDNAAHNMLMDKYGRQNMLDFWGNLGTNAIFTANNNWGVLNAHDALIYMSELYDFYARDDVYGEAVMTNFLNAYPTFLKGNGSYPVANKSGWSGTAIHDVAIVFADNPYIVVALSNTGTSDYNYYFDNANRLALELHNAYWKYKMDSCESIKQY